MSKVSRLLKAMKFACLLLCLLVTMGVRAGAIGEERMVNLTLTDGLSGETVNHIMTDHCGQIWIATNNGVDVYNGKSLLNLRISCNQQRTISVSSICEIAGRYIYAATDAGLFCLDYTGDKFKQVLPEIKQPGCLLAVGDTLYIGSRQGLHIYDGQQLKHIDVSVSRRGLDNIVRHFVRSDDGLIWFLGRYALCCYHPQTGKIDQYSLDDVLPEKVTLTQFDVDGSKFFIGTRYHGLYVYDLKSGGSCRLDRVGNLVMTVRRSTDGYICVATDGSGAFMVDPKTNQVVETFDTEAEGIKRLPTNAVYSFYRDNQGINWFGFVRYGLAYNPHDGRLFKPYVVDGFSTRGLNVRSYCMHGTQSLIGLQNGMWLIDRERHQKHFYSSSDFDGGHIVNNIVWYNGLYYVGTFDGGLRVLDPQSLEMRRDIHLPLLDNASIGDIKVGPDGCLWIGSSQGLFVIDSHGTFRQFTEQNSPIVGGQIVSMTFDRDGNAWLTGAAGLSLYSAVSREVVKTDFPDGFFNNEPYLRGILGHDGKIFMRNGPQLFYTSQDMRQFGELTMPIALTDKWCRSMVDDGKGHFWVASERGLFHFNYDMSDMLLLGDGEGLSGDQINEMSLDDDGRLWVATNRGLCSMNSNDLETWRKTVNYQVRLYTVWIDNTLALPLNEAIINEQHDINLKWNMTSDVFQARLVLQDFARHKGRLYEYRLDGGQWQTVQDEELMDIRGLFLGSHQLDVRLAGVEGTMTTYTMTVFPSIAAWVELILLLIALTLLWIGWRYRKTTKVLLSERDEIEDALIESEELRMKSEELVASMEEPALKYQKVKIDETECAEIVKRMREYMERERVYTNADLKMKDLADVLRLSPSKLSQVFNLYLKENYYEFINRYRLDEFKRLIAAGEHTRYTITALSEQCGFKKSNFFSTFRKVEGVTPVEYLKKQGIKV